MRRNALLLRQASEPVHGKILEAVERFDWELDGPIIWDKSRTPPRDLGAPYTRPTEML
jgi:hypothetical protein